MSKVRVDWQVLLDKGKSFNNKAATVDQMIGQLKGDMAMVFSTFEGASANKLQGEWEKWQNEMPKFRTFLEEIGTVLNKEGTRWQQTDQG